jgi:hypothetical protein
MNVRMKHDGLAPGMEHGENAEQSAKLGRSDIAQGLCGSTQEDGIDDLGRVHGQWVQALGNGKDDVEVRNVENLLAPLLEPALPGLGTTSGTVPVAA